jgi:hypothetical protein
MLLSRAAFDAEIQQIDDDLRREGIDIPFRPLRAVAEFAKHHKVGIYLFFQPLPPDAPISTEYLSSHVQAWYSRLYGDRLRLWSLSPGRMVIPIRGDLWHVRFPAIVGTVSFLACNAHDGAHTLDRGEYDIFQCFDGMTAAFRSALSQAELAVILRLFDRGIRAMSAVADLLPTDLTKAARADHDAAVQHLTGPHIHPGLSRWASHQAVEKLFKAFLEFKRASPPNIHPLSKLADRCTPLGLTPPPASLLDLVQCGAGVRYGEVVVSREEAVTAHHAALKASQVIASQLPRKNA